ncbi:MAG: hypothetical protein FJW88_05155 [Actinobacteria bacterium]|nr:hypothetical protein [Actinomycetota bacterium]
MITLWSTVAVLAALGSVALVLAARRVRDEVTLTVRAFAELRSALAPATFAVRDEAVALRERRDALTQGGSEHSWG